MDHSTSLKRAIYIIAAIAFFFTSSVELRAQGSKPLVRGVLIEEFTGTWCGYCPRGAWFMDSLQEYLGDNVVEIAWHNADEMTAMLQPSPSSQDTMEGYFGVTGFPNMGVMRNGAIGVGDWNPGDPTVVSLKKTAQTVPLVDFRIVNVAYDGASNTFSADLDITPFDMKKMPSDDIAKYVTLGVITEDNLDFDQHNYGLRGLPDYISPFLHHNVARSVSGSVTGNKFTLGTKDANLSLPVRIHYTFGVDGAWNAGYLRFKAFVDGITDTTIAAKKYQVNHVYNAAQTNYFVNYPQTPKDAMWVVLPNENSTTSPTAPTNIVWARGGNAGQNAKLEYSIDGGSKWNLIIASTNKSPYPWMIPTDAYGTMATIRITDASNPSTKSTSASIKTPGVIKIVTPAKDEVIQGGTSGYKVTFTGGNLKSPFSASYSLDNGATWNSAGNNLSNVDGREYTWSGTDGKGVPNVDATQAFFKIIDGNGVIGMSEMFSIKAVANKGAITAVTLDPFPADNQYNNGENIVVKWTTNGGNMGTGMDVYLSTENGIMNSWVKQNQTALATDETSFTFKAPTTGFYDNNCIVKVQSASDASINATTAGTFTIGQVTQGGVYSSTPKNGYSITNNPNPFSNETSIKFTLPVRGLVTITILDNLGRQIDQIAAKSYDAGSYSIPYNAANLANGVYTYTLEAGATKLAGKMSIVK